MTFWQDKDERGGGRRDVGLGLGLGLLGLNREYVCVGRRVAIRIRDGAYWVVDLGRGWIWFLGFDGGLYMFGLRVSG